MEPVLRSGQEPDVLAVLALWAEAGAEPSHTDDVDGLRVLLARDPEALIVAEWSGRIIGSVISGWDGWRGTIYRLAVSPDHRRAGVGRALLAAAEERLSAAGARRLQAVVVETSTDAVPFWDGSGWERQRRRLRYVSG